MTTELHNTPDATPRGGSCVVFDTETHSKDAPRIIEAAYGRVSEDNPYIMGPVTESRYNPLCPISLGALVTHSILDEELAECPPYTEFALPADVGFVIGHNVSFDLQACGYPQGVIAIDTYLLAQALIPGLDSYKQAAVLYAIAPDIGFSRQEIRSMVKNAHGAAADIKMCALLYGHMARMLTPYLEHILRAVDLDTKAPGAFFHALGWVGAALKMPLVMTFGKHQGMAVENVPASYKTWYCTQAEKTDPWVVFALEQSQQKSALFTKLVALRATMDAVLEEIHESTRPEAEPEIDLVRDSHGQLALFRPS